MRAYDWSDHEGTPEWKKWVGGFLVSLLVVLLCYGGARLFVYIAMNHPNLITNICYGGIVLFFLGFMTIVFKEMF